MSEWDLQSIRCLSLIHVQTASQARVHDRCSFRIALMVSLTVVMHGIQLDEVHILNINVA